MIEAEWWEYDSVDEMADAVAGDVGFIIESAIDARDASLLALPGGKTPMPDLQEARGAEARLEEGHHRPHRRAAGRGQRRAQQRAAAGAELHAGRRAGDPDRRRECRRRGGRQHRRRAASGPALAARSRLARHGRRRAYRVDLHRCPTCRMRWMPPRRGARSACGPTRCRPTCRSPRVTLTRAALLSARTLIITITGEEKKALLEQAIADGQSSKLPIGRVLAEAEQPIDIHWAP